MEIRFSRGLNKQKNRLKIVGQPTARPRREPVFSPSSSMVELTTPALEAPEAEMLGAPPRWTHRVPMFLEAGDTVYLPVK